MSRPRTVAPPDLETLTPAEGMAWGGLLYAHTELTRALDADLREAHGLPLAWYDVLRQLALAPGGGLRLSDLAGRVLLTQSGLSRLVDRLEREGLVCREPDPEDGRATQAVLTAKGAARLTEAHSTHVEGIRDRFLRHLSEEELKVLAGLWSRLRTVLNADER